MLTLWFLLKRVRSTQTAGGRSSRRSSAKVSGIRRPRPSFLRILSCVCWLLPYSGARSTYDDVSLMCTCWWDVRKTLAHDTT